ncbi:30S ribosomal protein S17 [Candidatus Curtissbacteria bacterium RIFCSPLOWO2_01_FULL_41_28]|uniref:Small ribosomal subunit protein uS17 n=1 Tax=Candidatus Curtissbacteria bacterium RIFOXYA1_FULL_41_14 TaxID=1797737 RepID=A0A1F5HCI6_9BACT|nr:MAG: 30S ribosomal protein S17 [Candidatus Curtissbacteria bacterium RIFCSPHIGHO2_12_FULL_41_13]OGD95397.1 MAG: 30S ribosomal protein S17 [Candidatus Curtissbacteria bacterium RIFCSPLOWO2_01_FULL_41_28]OGE01745.1 MAG: 30S ribosomal protein S17 [Candidatus Curtissbacteria bacterium RIFOXYA1_FULL_41_14]OGE05697.1 MAG: 30S ribosomal protein S17 [Candidatus Curtissbacteria bacterium RIFOXYB1_FULL_41_59]OGE08516.1 MAG: 30S ribosomal protein S17 [Candidatus Curtissbacteria bacterium RIFOXYD1_FULL_
MKRQKQERRKMPQVKTGIVISDKMQKTVVVKVSTKVRHPLYKKLITKTKKFKARNDLEVKVGQKVKIMETKPISKDIHFKVMEVLK